MPKKIKENCIVLSIYDLYRFNTLKKDHYSGIITWPGKYNNDTDKIDINIHKTNRYIELRYNIRSYVDNEWKNINYKIPLITTACNYGKERFWLACPSYNGNSYCGKKAAKLYLAPHADYFICRHCLNLSYESRNKNKNDKYYYLDKCFNLEKKAKQLKSEIKIEYRAGKPTKKYQKLIETNRLLSQAIDIVTQKIKNDITNFAKK